ncbi:MAG: sugar transferase [Phototrophicaceae bacterium]
MSDEIKTHMNARETSESTMIFSPSVSAKRGMQLRISERRLLMIFGDIIGSILAILVSLAIWANAGELDYDTSFILSQSIWFLILTTIWMILASANGYYEFSIAADFWGSFQRLVIINLQLIMIYVVIFFFAERDSLPRLFIIYYTGITFIWMLLWRLFNPALIGWASAERRILVIGTDWAAKTIIETLQNYAADAYSVVGIISDNATDTDTLYDVKIMGTAHDLMEIVSRENISELVVTSTRELSGDVFQAVMDAYEHGIAITPMPILYERITERVPVEHVGTNWAVVLPINGTSAFDPYPLLKRLMDIVIALFGFILFIPIFPFIALAIYLDSRGSIFYSQIRVGLNGNPYRIYKLRSMAQNAEAETGAVFAQKNDMRVTRVGKFMRKTRLDELPQLWNILKGDMSMIGPRPERPEHVKRLQEKIPFYRTRHIIRPGVTGWAQVRYGYGANDDDALVKLQYDLYYIRHQSLLLDFGILIRTVGRVIRMSGQ